MKSILSPLSKRFNHPLFASLLITAGLFFLIGLSLDLAGSNPIAAGFFGVYAIIAMLLGILGYGGMFVVKQISQLRDGSTQRVETESA